MSTAGFNNNSLDSTRYCFLAEWFDTAASLVRKYQVYWYLADGSVELVSQPVQAAQN